MRESPLEFSIYCGVFVFVGHCGLRLSSEGFLDRGEERWYGKNNSAREPLYTFVTRLRYPDRHHNARPSFLGFRSTKGCRNYWLEVSNLCHSAMLISCPRPQDSIFFTVSLFGPLDNEYLCIHKTGISDYLQVSLRELALAWLHALAKTGMTFPPTLQPERRPSTRVARYLQLRIQVPDDQLVSIIITLKFPQTSGLSPWIFVSSVEYRAEIDYGRSVSTDGGRRAAPVTTGIHVCFWRFNRPGR